MSVHEKMTAIANAIREKTGGTDALTLDQMAEAIAGIESGGGGGAQVLTYTAASLISENYLVIEIEHGLGKIPTAVLAVNESFLDVWGTDTSHHTWILAAGRNFSFRMASTGTTALIQSPRANVLGIADTTTDNICYADTEKIYLHMEPWRGLCAGETLSIYVWE